MDSTLERLHGPDPFDTAAGKELMRPMAEQRTMEAVERFYLVRRKWCGGGSMICWGPSSTHPFHDLPPALNADDAKALLPLVLELAAREPWQTFPCGLCLIHTVLAKHPVERTAGLGEGLLRLVPNAIAADMFGVNDHWQWVLDAARPILTVSGEQGVLDRLPSRQQLPPWWTVLPAPRLVTDPEPLADCDADRNRVEELAQGPKCGTRCVFSSAYTHLGARWWAWRCEPNDPKWMYLPHVLYRRGADGEGQYFLEHLSMPRKPFGFDLHDIIWHIARWEAKREREQIVDGGG